MSPPISATPSRVILDAGPTGIGLESTVVGFDGDRAVLLRPGGLPRAEIERVLGAPLLVPRHDPDRPASPGMLAKHYAPAARLRLDARDVRPGEALLAFGPALPPGADEARRRLQPQPVRRPHRGRREPLRRAPRRSTKRPTGSR